MIVMFAFCCSLYRDSEIEIEYRFGSEKSKRPNSFINELGGMLNHRFLVYEELIIELKTLFQYLFLLLKPPSCNAISNRFCNNYKRSGEGHPHTCGAIKKYTFTRRINQNNNNFYNNDRK